MGAGKGGVDFITLQIQDLCKGKEETLTAAALPSIERKTQITTKFEVSWGTLVRGVHLFLKSNPSGSIIFQLKL